MGKLIAFIIRQLFLPTSREIKPKYGAFIINLSRGRFGQRMDHDAAAKCCCVQQRYTTRLCCKKITSNDLGLSSSFWSSTSWQMLYWNYICVSSYCELPTLSDYFYFPFYVVFHFKIWFILMRTCAETCFVIVREKCSGRKKFVCSSHLFTFKSCTASWGIIKSLFWY